MYENYVTKQGKSKLSDSHLASLMYAIVMCKAKLTATHGIGIYNLTKHQNARCSYEFLISIDRDMVSKFEDMTKIKLKEPITAYRPV